MYVNVFTMYVSTNLNIIFVEALLLQLGPTWMVLLLFLN